uniref:C-type lectin domain-containing protein n=1 Tax=Anopheles maculatus TaxID=74869 RepID=A0A182SE75_9DIPT
MFSDVHDGSLWLGYTPTRCHACRQKGGHLASVESADENARVEAAIKAVVGDKASYWWIGGMDYGAEGRFVWYPLNKVVDYKNFVPGEPNNSYGAEDCLAVDSTKQYKWNDVGCNAQVEGYVCAFIR